VSDPSWELEDGLPPLGDFSEPAAPQGEHDWRQEEGSDAQIAFPVKLLILRTVLRRLME
jgi:hypothetical protein